MRRSLRDAFVGFSLLGGLVIFSGAMLWLKDFRLGSKTWEISASFKDASGLAQMSPVTYRGIIVGSVQKINFTPNTVDTKIKLNKNDKIMCALYRPCLLYTSPSPRDRTRARMPSSA